MPIHPPSGLRRLDDTEFKQVVYEVMEVVFAVHNEMGRLFDELVYQRAIAQRVRDADTEVPLEVSFDSFRKTYYLDLLVGRGALFELKADEALHDRHRSQILNYLFLLDLPHGKLLNLGNEQVQHEFINAPLSRADRTGFSVDDSHYTKTTAQALDLRDVLVPMLRDWGTCLDVKLYEEAPLHFLGVPPADARPVEITVGGVVVGAQKLLLASPDTSFCITALTKNRERYGEQLRRFIRHTSLKVTQWINVDRRRITFTTIRV